MNILEFHYEGGREFMTILSLSFTTIIVGTVLNIARLVKGNYDAGKQFLVIHDIRSIGVFAIVCGIFGQSIGMFTALELLAEAADISPTMIYDGIRVSSITTLYGTFIFLISILISVGLTNWSRRLGS